MLYRVGLESIITYLVDFPRVIVVLSFFFVFYILLQVYLYLRFRDYLRARIQHKGRRKLLCGLVASFLFLTLLPIAGHIFLNWDLHERYPFAMRILFSSFAVWAFGSGGCAVILAGYDFCSRFFAQRSPQAEAVDSGRRDFLRKGLGLAAATPFLISGYGVIRSRFRFQVEHFELPINGLPSALANLSIVHLSDIHMGPFMPREELAKYVEATNSLQPDLVALTGDFLTISADEVHPCVETLAGLKAKYGIFVCLGNHDVFAGAENQLTRQFNQRGIRVLRNDATTLRVRNATMSILGIDDILWGDYDLTRAMRASEKEPGELKLLLSHRPEVFPSASRMGVDVVLSGHYHGGQVKLAPYPESLSIARLITPYAEGLFHLSGRTHSPGMKGAKDSLLFVTRGVGITGLPIRINCPPQIAHLTLVPNRKA